MKKVKIFSVVVLLLVDIMMCEEDVRETETGLCAEGTVTFDQNPFVQMDI